MHGVLEQAQGKHQALRNNGQIGWDCGRSFYTLLTVVERAGSSTYEVDPERRLQQRRVHLMRNLDGWIAQHVRRASATDTWWVLAVGSGARFRIAGRDDKGCEYLVGVGRRQRVYDAILCGKGWAPPPVGEEDVVVRWRRGCRRRWQGGTGRHRMEEAVAMANIE